MGVQSGEPEHAKEAMRAFFEAVERGWRPVATYALKPFPGGCEKLWILERQAGFGLAALAAMGSHGKRGVVLQEGCAALANKEIG